MSLFNLFSTRTKKKNNDVLEGIWNKKMITFKNHEGQRIILETVSEARGNDIRVILINDNGKWNVFNHDEIVLIKNK